MSALELREPAKRVLGLAQSASQLGELGRGVGGNRPDDELVGRQLRIGAEANAEVLGQLGRRCDLCVFELDSATVPNRDDEPCGLEQINDARPC